MDGADDRVVPPKAAEDLYGRFGKKHIHCLVEGAGHNLPQEKPEIFGKAILSLMSGI